MKKSILTLWAILGLAAGTHAATMSYVSESAWLGSSAWSQWSHSQTTETFDSYATRSYFNAGDSARGSQTVPIVPSVTYSASTPANTMTIVRTQGIWDGDFFGAFKTYSDNAVNYSYNPLRVEDAATASSTAGFMSAGYGGTGKYLSFFKNSTSDIFRISFTAGVSAVSLRLGDFGDGGGNSGLKITDSTGATLWDSTGKASQTYGGQTLTVGDASWAFLGFTTDNPNGFTYLDFNLTGDADDNIAIDNVRFNTVPEPSAASLIIFSAGALLALRRRRGAV